MLHLLSGPARAGALAATALALLAASAHATDRYEGSWKWRKGHHANRSVLEFYDGRTGGYCYNDRCFDVTFRAGADGSNSFSLSGKNLFRFKSPSPDIVDGWFWSDPTKSKTPDATVRMHLK